MQQRRGRFLRHARIAIGGAGHHAFEQRKHAAHTVDAVEGGDEMHLGGAWIGKAYVDAAADKSAHEAFRAVHSILQNRGINLSASPA